MLMSDPESCCRPGVASNQGRSCPRCGQAGSLVETQAVKASVTDEALARIPHAAFRFCAVSSCPVVYFAETTTFATTDVRVPVWQKLPAGDRTICYCFGENEGGIRAEILRDGRSEAVERVRAHIKARRCACDIRNPRGVCCLGDLLAAVARASEDIKARQHAEPRQHDVSNR